MSGQEQASHPKSRRAFLGSAAAGVPLLASPAVQHRAVAGQQQLELGRDDDHFTTAQLRALRAEIRAELFERVLPFWDRHGIDQEHGGFMCALNYDGTLRHTDKYHWYQGRGIWVYSYLFNHFGRDERYLEIARRAKDFWLQHAIGADGWWAEAVARDGTVIKPFQGDVYGMFCAAEGLQEFAWAAQDDSARELARQLLNKLFERVNNPDYQDLYAPQKGYRVQGVWMYLLQACTQYLRRWDDNQLERFAEFSVDAIMKKHFNPQLGLINEYVAADFSHPPDVANLCLVGHCVQAFWMVLDEALRRGDADSVDRCCELTRRHLDVGWDHVYGGLAEWVNVDQRTHQWGPQQFGDVTIDLEMVGEFNYLKSFWSLNEVMLTTMYVYQLRRSSWAARYFRLARDVVDRKFSRHRLGQATYVLAADRKMERTPSGTRQDNYHPARRMMRNLLSIDQMLSEEDAG